MPHKHVRGRNDQAARFNIPPSEIARPLLVGKRKDAENKVRRRSKQGVNSAQNYHADDTPKAFLRLLQRQAGQRRVSSLDNGDASASKKRKRGQVQPPKPAPDQTQEPVLANPQEVADVDEAPPQGRLKILPGERLKDFAARVDQALPVSGIARRPKSELGPRERQTKTEKRLQKMYADWRKEDARLKEKIEEEQENVEEEEEELAAKYGEEVRAMPAVRGKRVRQDDDDPWAELKNTRSTRNGLHDVVQAPPEFSNLPREKLKAQSKSDLSMHGIPSTGVSLKMREELSRARLETIQRYKEMMSKRGGDR